MAAKVVWFDILGEDDKKLQDFYADLFGWEYDTTTMPGYGMTDPEKTGVGGGVGKGPDGTKWAIFYVGVDDIDLAIKKVQDNGGSIVMPKMDVPNGPTIAAFTDPDGNTIGLVQNVQQ